MSKINIFEIQPAKSELKVLNKNETELVFGGRRRIRNQFVNQSNTANIFIVSNLVNIQIAFGGGSNTSVNSITNNAGVIQTNNA
ncbi:hypothetical protein I4641_07295 [Waterburya agarophytonicola K14]|uniref:Uncharacterized protein n=1 Tax=Waterburya agarophytonicola KI4 TaxID=2874699 RepID=A0A964BQ36_9CYAN|nr:hypothetical protein [Waterburya agarophytonicola]MCC0176782.1 hypothetical protein [Waterburya agarophytonicola KI4]